MSAIGGLDIAFWDLRGKAAGSACLAAPRRVRAAAARRTRAAFSGRTTSPSWRRRPRAIVANGFRRVKMRLGRSCGVRPRRRRGGAARRRRGERRASSTARTATASTGRCGWAASSPRAASSGSRSRSRRRRSTATSRLRRSDRRAARGRRERLRRAGLPRDDPRRRHRHRPARRLPGRRHQRSASGSGSSRRRPVCTVGTHTWSDAVALVANAHFVAALPNGLTVEVDQTGNPFIDELLAEPLRDRGRPSAARRPPRARHRARPATLVRRLSGRLRRPDGGRQLLRPDLRARVRIGRAAVRAVSLAAPGGGGVFDAHHHLWDTRVLEYRLFGQVPELDRPFLLADYEPEARSLGVSGSLWVEAASAGADGARELDWVTEHVTGNELVEGLVAYVALERAEGELDRLFDRSGLPVVGVRRSFEFEDPGFARRPEVASGVRLAGEHGLVVDLVLFRRHSPRCSTWSTLPRHPVRARPPRQARHSAGGVGALGVAASSAVGAAKPRREALRARDGGRPCRLETRGSESVCRARTKTFGPDRLLYGSDWPVVELAGGHSRWIEALTELLAA